MAQRVTMDEFEEKVICFPGVAIVDFYSDSCVPCKRMSPVLSALETKYESDIFVAKVNIAYEKELVNKFQVISTPTFLFFKNGEVIERFSGAKKKEELEQIIEANK
ncbi:MAG: thioredoxin family protein [Lachnospiraceae bacterium]|nr:thioredoxin family protein [Lachnospiraceae bacterium]